jgi:toxin YoeB
MTYKVRYSDDANKTIAKYKKSNPVAYKKFTRLLKEITEHPREGTGHPEPLIKGSSVTYSRRISANDRIIYDVYDDIVIVLILSIEGHYNDR